MLLKLLMGNPDIRDKIIKESEGKFYAYLPSPAVVVKGEYYQTAKSRSLPVKETNLNHLITACF
jgi:hypothetical protein